MDLRIPFKGDRTYLHGTDLFNALVAATGADRDIELTIFRPMTRLPAATRTDRTKAKTETAGALFCTGAECWSITETENEVTERVPYDEGAIVSNGLIADESIVGPIAKSFIETAVAYNKALLSSVTGNADWWFVRLELKRVPPASGEVKVRLLVQSRMTKSSIEIDGDEVGYIYFSRKT